VGWQNNRCFKKTNRLRLPTDPNCAAPAGVVLTATIPPLFFLNFLNLMFDQLLFYKFAINFASGIINSAVPTVAIFSSTGSGVVSSFQQPFQASLHPKAPAGRTAICTHPQPHPSHWHNWNFDRYCQSASEYLSVGDSGVRNSPGTSATHQFQALSNFTFAQFEYLQIPK